ncbi:P-loop containing nucleoside triphosphate hydrolase protein [Auriculariales sp. MPI-PUGE-AT-0066]|nr:P-loop containing nucleoside triphosphate hydrolase protein [Auriculariales sp. MPI-PUGE-AT-0066]
MVALPEDTSFLTPTPAPAVEATVSANETGQSVVSATATTSTDGDTATTPTETAPVEPAVNGTVNSTMEEAAEPPKKLLPIGSVAGFKRLDERYNRETYTYDVTETAEISAKARERDDSELFAEYCFNVVRRFDSAHGKPTWTKLQINSKWLKKECSKVIGNQGAVAWSSSRRVLVFGSLRTRLHQLKQQQKTNESNIEQFQCLLDFVRDECRLELDEYESMLARKDITFDHLGNLFIPDTIFMSTPAHWVIEAVYIDSTAEYTHDESVLPFGFAKMQFRIFSFKNTTKIFSGLPVFPMEYHPEKDHVCSKLVERGRRWEALDGIHHMYYTGNTGRVMVNSRIMIDNALYTEYHQSFAEILHPNRYSYNEWVGDSDNEDGDEETSTEKHPLLSELEEEHLLIASPILYGFSFDDKRWLTFNVEQVRQIKWNDEAFANLVLPEFTKDLMRGLVESQSSTFQFDDFIEGKGRGIVICLAGSPGVGKTMSAESVSEHLRRPLYIVGGGELPIHASGLDQELTRIFKVGARWGAVVLIDEADVFLEKRSVHDLNRNALVAVFLRQLEYFPGLLFLTTNRICSFDEAFQSRIHVSLKFNDLDEEARRKIWRAFIAKIADTCAGPLTTLEENELASKKMNGRQIKNAVRTAGALATSRKQKVTFAHFKGVVEIMEQFQRDFGEMNAAA